MGDKLAQYACDFCRSRKIACSREVSGCKKCKDLSIDCNYSRAGVIRRNRQKKRNNTGPSPVLPSPGPSAGDNSSSHATPKPEYVGMRTQLEVDIDITREQLQKLPVGHGSIGALSLLSSEYEAFWQDNSDHARLADEDANLSAKGYFLFEEHAQAWTDIYVAATRRGRPLLTEPPAEVISFLASAQPDRISQRAYLVMYYGVVLSTLSSKGLADGDTKAKLRANLWFALNDVRLLLEPSDVNIQALVLLGCHVEDFTTPSLSWMLLSTACRMLQALGITSKRLDESTRKRRCHLFWILNAIDKSLALMYGRTPTFHRAMGNEVPMPSVQDLMPTSLMQTSAGLPAMFAAHFIYQMHLQSKIMADIWCVLYDAGNTGLTIQSVKDELESWQRSSTQMLQACALAEAPLLTPAAVETMKFASSAGACLLYLPLAIYLARAMPDWADECIDKSRQLLHALGSFENDNWEEPYNGVGVVWQMLYCPFAAFFTLYRRILAAESSRRDELVRDLEAMEQLPTFLATMGGSGGQAAKLHRIALTFAQHARSVVYGGGGGGGGGGGEGRAGSRGQAAGSFQPTTQSQSQSQQQVPLAPPSEPMATPQSLASHPKVAAWQDGQRAATLGTPAIVGEGHVDSGGGAFDLSQAEMDQLLAWLPQQQDPFSDTMFDWLAWDSQMG